MKRVLFQIGALMACLLSAATADARTHKVAPESVVLVQEEGAAKLLLSFDFRNFPRLSGWTVQDAYLEWTSNARPTTGAAQFSAYPVVEARGTHGLGPNGSLEVDRGRGSDYGIEVLEVERNGEGIVRLDVSDIVRKWIEGSTADKGLLVETEALSAAELFGEAEGMLIHVLYTAAPR